MEKKFTPGPWLRSPTTPEWIVSSRSQGGDICKVSEHAGYDEMTETDLANARLIAAAPDLLEALEAALKELEQFIPVTDVKVIDKVKAAISKALNIK